MARLRHLPRVCGQAGGDFDLLLGMLAAPINKMTFTDLVGALLPIAGEWKTKSLVPRDSVTGYSCSNDLIF